jgi:hypothetical protein
MRILTLKMFNRWKWKGVILECKLGCHERGECMEMVSVVQRKQLNAHDERSWRPNSSSGASSSTPPPHQTVSTLHHLHLKKFFANQSLRYKRSCAGLAQSLKAIFFDAGIQKLIPRHAECLNLHGNYPHVQQLNAGTNLLQ